MKTYKYTGSVDKLRMLTFERSPLIRFTLLFKENRLNCLIHTHALNFLAEVSEGSLLSISGYYNQRQQFVVQDYTVIGKSKLVTEFETSIYPLQRTY